MLISDFKKQLHVLRISKHKLINDTYIWYELVFNGLEIMQSNEDSGGRYKIPSTNPNRKIKTVLRTQEDFKRIIKDAKEKHINATLIIFFTAQTEAYIADVKRLIKKISNFRGDQKLSMLLDKKISFLPDDFTTKWIEIQQTRHLLLHTDGTIDSNYLNKCGDLARGGEGEKICTDRNYLEFTARLTKSLIGKIDSYLGRNL